MTTIELPEVQGFLVSDYDKLGFAQYLLLNVKDAPKAKEWLNNIVPSVANATTNPDKNCLNIGFTNLGLLALGMNHENLNGFSNEFREGMTTTHRKRLLGDFNENSPQLWDWGGRNKCKGTCICDDKICETTEFGNINSHEEVHIMAMLFAADENTLKAESEALKQNAENSGLNIIKILDGHMLEDNKEHFGFRDGISQPFIKGSGIVGPENNTVATGEFIMGYKNNYNVFPQSPFIHSSQGDVNILPADSEGSGHKDLGKNGSYLVFRQMEQDMGKFWNFINESSNNEDGSINENASIKLASKMVGRWPSGAPLAKFPDKDPGVLSNDDEISYAKDDQEGMKCPFGSHLRRLNPRDSFEDNGPKKSIQLSNRHRIIRRARHFGSKEVSSPTKQDNSTSSGLHFMCFNADISRQFEFIQYSWANNPRVSELYDDPDPLIGVTNSPNNVHKHQNENNVFTIPEKPVNRKVKGIQRFVKIKGGAYFFYPSITAIKYLASL